MNTFQHRDSTPAFRIPYILQALHNDGFYFFKTCFVAFCAFLMCVIFLVSLEAADGHVRVLDKVNLAPWQTRVCLKIPPRPAGVFFSIFSRLFRISCVRRLSFVRGIPCVCWVNVWHFCCLLGQVLLLLCSWVFQNACGFRCPDFEQGKYIIPVHPAL